MATPRTPRPWGWYQVLSIGEGFKVKMLEVKPGKRLSLQRHKYRSEHWVVVTGRAKITRGTKTLYLKHDESTYIPKTVLHRIANPSRTKRLLIVETQCGKYTGEDDIERFQDDHGR